MAANRYNQLVTFLDDRAGDYFRAAIRYDPDGWEILHLRAGIDRQELEEQLPRLHGIIKDRQAIVREDEYPPLGESEGAIELHEHGTLLHIREGESAGVVVTLDRDAGRNLAGFVEKCRDLLGTSTDS